MLISLTTSVNDIEHIESQSLAGLSITKVFFQPSANIPTAIAQSAAPFDIASDRYKGGVDTFLDVITAQQSLLTNQRQAVQIQGQQLTTAVFLVKALGGGWSQPAPQIFHGT